MAENRVKLTKTVIAKIEAQDGKQRLVWDSEVRGFGIRVSPGGAKAYVMQRRVGKTSRRMTIGRVEDMTPEAARKRALGLAGKFADGIDPVAEKRRQEAREITLRDAFERYLEAPTQKGVARGAPKKAGTVRDIRKHMRSFNDWMDLPITEISGNMVKKRHTELAARSAAQANLSCRYLRAAFNHAIADADDDDEPIIARNPVDRLNRTHQWAPVARAERHIPDDRIADWVAAIQTRLVGLKFENEIRDGLLFLTLTGARLAEVFGDASVGYLPLAWDDVDLDKRVVVFRDTKNRTDHEMPIGTELAGLLTARKHVSGRDFVFSDEAGQLPKSLRPALKRLEDALGFRTSAHDLRRTFSTVASRLDISAYKLKRLTNHRNTGDVTMGYVQVATEDLRPSIQAIEDYYLSPALDRSDDKVVQLVAAR